MLCFSEILVIGKITPKMFIELGDKKMFDGCGYFKKNECRELAKDIGYYNCRFSWEEWVMSLTKKELESFYSKLLKLPS